MGDVAEGCGDGVWVVVFEAVVGKSEPADCEAEGFIRYLLDMISTQFWQGGGGKNGPTRQGRSLVIHQ